MCGGLNALLSIVALESRPDWGRTMLENPMMIFGVTIVLGIVLNVLRLWTFVQGSGAKRRARMERIGEMDSHLSFDERIAERLRELEREKVIEPAAVSPPVQATSAPTAPSQGFGRRQA
jgi:hypothetical protein